MRFSPIALILCAPLLAGCTGPVGPGSHAGEPYIVTAQRTLFYSFGPAQTSGPDFDLPRGQRVTMLSFDYGYSQVAIQGTGKSGYVPTEDLAPAPPTTGADPTVSPTVPHHHRRSAHPDDNLPPAPGGPSKIPLPEFPESEPPPGTPPFRY